MCKQFILILAAKLGRKQTRKMQNRKQVWKQVVSEQKVKMLRNNKVSGEKCEDQKP